jgi:outer membrane protein TolC
MNASRLSILGLLIVLAPASYAQDAPVPRDTASLAALQRAAREHDPRLRQLNLLTSQSRLRDETIAADRKPTVSLDALAQYQSTVTEFPLTLPGGPVIPRPPHDTYDAKVSTQYRLYDATITPRRAVERAQLAESQARVNTSLYALRQNVNDAFFAILRADAQRTELETTLTDLEAQINVAAARVREGTALPSEANVLRAEALRRRQSISELNAARATAVDLLADLSGQPVATIAFTLPEVDLDYARASALVDNTRGRPEIDQFARTRELLDRQRAARAAQDKPRVSAFARAGYGKPGLNPLNNTFDSYWLAGVQAQWTPWNWGTTDREREVLEIQQQIVTADEQAFREALRRATRQDLETMQRLERELASDDEIIALRETVLTEARARFSEAVITSAEFIDRQTDVLSARVTRSLHRVELAQARARFLTTLGIETR